LGLDEYFFLAMSSNANLQTEELSNIFTLNSFVYWAKEDAIIETN
jgi:hypothetical protein